MLSAVIGVETDHCIMDIPANGVGTSRTISVKDAETRRERAGSSYTGNIPGTMPKEEETSWCLLEDLGDLLIIDVGSLSRFIVSSRWFYD